MLLIPERVMYELTLCAQEMNSYPIFTEDWGADESVSFTVLLLQF